MSLITQIFENLTSKHKDEDLSNIAILLLIRIFNVIGLIFFSFILTVELLKELHFSSIVLVAPILILLINLFINSFEIKKTELSINLLIISFILACIYFIIRLPFSLTGITAIFGFPVLVFFLKGKKKGNHISLIFIFLVIGAIILLKNFVSGYNDFSYLFLIKTLGIYIILHFLLFAYEDLKLVIKDWNKNQIKSLKNDNKVKDEFISHLSHQIRTPLNNIMVIANLVNETELNDNQKDLMDTIIASTSTLVNVVNNIVKVTNVEFAASSSSLSTFEIVPTIKSSINIIGEHHKEKVDINLKAESGLSSLDVYGDPLRLKQIFLNIIENIIDHSSKLRTSIDISLNLMKVSDDSSEIKLFSNITCNTILPFQQEDISEFKLTHFKHHDSAKDIIEEIPLCDLTIAKKILELNNSKLSIDSGEEYSSFSFILNFEKPEKDKNKKVSVESDSSLLKKPKKINISDANLLLVEDNLINQKIVILSLKKLVKNIDVANNGKEALDKFGTSKYDLILMDIQMPVMNGIVATKKIRELEFSSNSQTPIIAITANALAGDKETCLAAGMNDYISKPFQVDILVQKMKNLLE